MQRKQLSRLVEINLSVDSSATGVYVAIAVASFAYPLVVVSWDLHSEQLRIYIFVMAVLWDLHRILKPQQHRGFYRHHVALRLLMSVTGFLNRKKMLQERCQSVLKISYISTRKMRSGILAPMNLPGALTLPSGKAGFHHRFLPKAYQSSESSLRLPPVSP